MIKKQKLYYCILIMSFLSFATLEINVAYLVGIFTLGAVFFGVLTNKLRLTKFSVLLSLLGALLLFGQMLTLFVQAGLVGENPGRYLGSGNLNFLSILLFVLCIFFGFASNVVSHALSFNSRISVYRAYSNALIVFLVIDLMVRLLMFDPSQGLLYGIKHGIFYYDSNFTGVLILSSIFIFDYLKRIDVFEIGNVKKILLILLLLGTFSRAAIAAYLLAAIFIKFKDRLKVIYIALLLTVVFLGFELLMGYMAGDDILDYDGSFRSKFYILSLLIDLYPSLPIFLKLFGVGLGNAEQYLGIFAHNIIVTFVLEFGLFAALGVMAMLFILHHLYRGLFSYTTLPIAIVGFSLFSAYMPFYFVYIGVLARESQYVRGAS